MESVQPRTDAAARYGPVTATPAVQPATRAAAGRPDAAGQGPAVNASPSGETTATFSRRAQELSARQSTQDVQQEERQNSQQASEAVQARQVAESAAAADMARASAQQGAPAARDAQVRRAYQGVDGVASAG